MRTSLSNTIGVELEFSSELSWSSVKHAVRDKLRCHSIETEVFDYDDGEGEDLEGRYWFVKEDGSCYTDDNNGIEINSPPLRNRDMAEFAHVCAVARECGEVNRQCGTHVHHMFPRLSTPEFQGVLASWIRFEPFLFKLVAPSRRRNTYCQTYLTNYPEARDVFAWLREPSDTRDFTRYYNLNTTHWWRTGRFEVRLHHGSLNAHKIWDWAQLTQHVIHAGTQVTAPEKLPAFDFRAPIKEQLGVFRDFLGLSMTSAELEHFDRVLPERLRKYNKDLRPELETV